MAKGIYIVGTGTDVGKTYVTALLLKALRQAGYDAGYYKPAISGAPSVTASDAGYVNRITSIGEEENLLLSYRYDHAVSPHLAAQWEGKPLEKDVILNAWHAVTERYPYVVVEGSGGIICPLRHDNEKTYFLEDVIQWLKIPSLIVGPAGLGSINAVVLTAHYMQTNGLPVHGILLNHYTGSPMEDDNIQMIEMLTNLPVLATIRTGDTMLRGTVQSLVDCFA